MAQRSNKRSNKRTRGSSNGSTATKTKSRARSRGATNGRSALQKKTTSGAVSQKAKGRSASQKPEKYRFAQNVDGELTQAEKAYRAYATGDGEMADPDVLLAVPVVKVDRIHLELDNLDAHVAVKAKVFDILKLAVGVDVHLGKLTIDIEGVEAQAIAKVRLDHIAAVMDRVLTAVDRNPELVENIGASIEHIGSGTGEAMDETGEGAEHVGEGAKEAIGEVGEGAGEAVQGAGQGAGQAVQGVGQGAGEAVEGVGQGAGQAGGNLGQTVEGVGQAAGQLGEGAGEAAGGLTEGVGDVAGGLLEGGGGGGGGQNGGGGLEGISAPALAREAVKAAAKQLGSAASEEAKELSLAATRRVMEMGERRREHRADKHNATAAAVREAADAGIDIEQLEGTGTDGRVTLKDVQKALKS